MALARSALSAERSRSGVGQSGWRKTLEATRGDRRSSCGLSSDNPRRTLRRSAQRGDQAIEGCGRFLGRALRPQTGVPGCCLTVAAFDDRHAAALALPQHDDSFRIEPTNPRTIQEIVEPRYAARPRCGAAPRWGRGSFCLQPVFCVAIDEARSLAGLTGTALAVICDRRLSPELRSGRKGRLCRNASRPGPDYGTRDKRDARP